MSVAAVVRIFFPNNEKFYGLFEEVARNLVHMAEKFEAHVAEEDPERRVVSLNEMEAIEHLNDDVTHRLYIALGKNFITPFDREDIHYLASTLDDIIDYIWNSVRRMADFNVHQLDAPVIDFAQKVSRIAVEVEKAVKQLRDIRNLMQITESCVLIGQMARECDDLMDNTMVDMFAKATDATEVVKKLDIYETLQHVSDKCNDAANVVETILIKYS